MPNMRLFRSLLLAFFTLALVACSGEHGYTRSSFQLKVVDKPATDIEAFAGKPDAVENLSSGEVIWTFNKRTFDSENANAKDAAVKVTLKKGTDGKLTYSGIDFLPQ